MSQSQSENYYTILQGFRVNDIKLLALQLMAGDTVQGATHRWSTDPVYLARLGNMLGQGATLHDVMCKVESDAPTLPATSSKVDLLWYYGRAESVIGAINLFRLLSEVAKGGQDGTGLQPQGGSQ